MHPSVNALWRAYLRSIGETPATTDKAFAAWSFGDTEKLADDLHIVTDSAGVAQCVLQTVQVAVTPFNEVDAAYAHLEGEGDRSLDYWRRTHWAYYERVLADTDYAPRPDMPVVCERFEVVFTREQLPSEQHRP